MNREKIFEELEREIEYHSPHTQRQYRAHVGDYLKFVGNRDWRDRDVLYNYIGKLRKRELYQSHITYLLRGPLNALFRAHGLVIPAKVPKFKGPRVDLTTRVAFTFEEVLTLIKSVRQYGSDQWQAFMALSTTFGLRASEIRQLTPKDIKKGKNIMIYTLKEGLPREHIIPEQILPYVAAYDYPILSEGAMFIIFNNICEAAGVQRVRKKSWHAVRHTVLTQLLLAQGNVKESVIYNFMRWKPPGMLGIYYTPQAFEEDMLIYPIHPFLKYWE